VRYWQAVTGRAQSGPNKPLWQPRVQHVAVGKCMRRSTRVLIGQVERRPAIPALNAMLTFDVVIMPRQIRLGCYRMPSLALRRFRPA
jgi:hypothetical protein